MMTLAFFTGGIPGIGEIGIIALILALLFGARKLPELARALGSSLTEFKKGKRDGAQEDKKLEPQMNATPPSLEDDGRRKENKTGSAD